MNFFDDVAPRDGVQKTSEDAFYGMSWYGLEKLMVEKRFQNGLKQQIVDKETGSKLGRVAIYYNPNNGLLIWADSSFNEAAGREGEITCRLCGVIDYSQLGRESRKNRNKLFKTLTDYSINSAINGECSFSCSLNCELANDIENLEKYATLLPKWNEAKPALDLGRCPIQGQEAIDSCIKQLPPDAQNIINLTPANGIKEDNLSRSSYPFYEFIELIKGLGFELGFSEIKHDTSLGVINDRSVIGDHRIYFNTKNGLIINIESYQPSGGICSATLYGMIENERMAIKNLHNILKGYPDESKQFNMREGVKEGIGFSLKVDSFSNDGLLTEELINIIKQPELASKFLPIWEGENKPDIDMEDLIIAKLPKQARSIIDARIEYIGRSINPFRKLL